MTYVLNEYERLELNPDAPPLCDLDDQAQSCLFGYRIACDDKYGHEACLVAFGCTPNPITGMTCAVGSPTPVPLPPSGFILGVAVLLLFVIWRIKA